MTPSENSHVATLIAATGGLDTTVDHVPITSAASPSDRPSAPREVEPGPKRSSTESRDVLCARIGAASRTLAMILGLLLIRGFMTEVQYHGRGNVVTMSKLRNGKTEE